MSRETLRYGSWARGRDVLCCALLAFLLPLPILGSLWPEWRPDVYFGAVGGVLAVALAVVVRWRWITWAAVDTEGIAVGAGADDSAQRLAWLELSEVGLLRNGVLILRGGDVTIHLSADLGDLHLHRLRILREQAPDMFFRLREAFRRGETLDFHGPESPSWAAAKGILWAMLVGVPMCFPLWRATPVLGTGMALLIGLAMLARRAVACETIRADLDGLQVRRLRTSRFPWSLLRGATLKVDHRLLMDFGEAGVLIVSPELGNFIVLQEIVLERAPGGVLSS